MLLRKVLASKTLAAALRFRFSSHAVASHDSHSDAHHDSHGHGHGHHKPYDWRDDPKLNKELEENIQNRGWDPESYSYPYEGKMQTIQVYPDDYDPSNLKMTFYPERKKNEHVIQSMPPGYWNPEGDFAHEADYESEDLDFQAESFKLQHFKKKGPIFPWVIAGALPFIFFWAEFILQHYPDEDYWRIGVPPPLDHPDSDDTDDTETYRDYFGPEGRYLVDTGIIKELWYDIKDGKKVYRKWAGVNQPLPL